MGQCELYTRQEPCIVNAQQMWAPIISYYTCSGILCDFQAAGEPNVSAAQEGLGSTLWRQGALGPRPKLVSAVLFC